MSDGGVAEAAGMINALKTGNVILDMLVAFSIPIFVRILWSTFEGGKSLFGDMSWENIFVRYMGYHERCIENKTMMTSWGDMRQMSDNGSCNNVLLKAIQLYLDHKEIEFRTSKVQLQKMTASVNRWGYDSDSDDDDGDDDGDNSFARKLKKFRIAKQAPTWVWQPIGNYGWGKWEVTLKVEVNSEDVGEKSDKQINTTRYRLRSQRAEAIDGFIDEAYQWYLSELRKLSDRSRYLYEMQTTPDSENQKLYKRYKLASEKTFRSLFFEEKDELLKLLDNFSAKKGRFAIDGFPWKVGVLLYGPPGTGKTSLIKALAHHTGRSIVNVPLARIKTNQELMDIMMDGKYSVQGESLEVKLGFKDVIFVMEDVDSASNVVHRRDGKTGTAVTRTDVVAPAKPKCPWDMLVERSYGDMENTKTLVHLLMRSSPRLRKAAGRRELSTGVAQSLQVLGDQLETAAAAQASKAKPGFDTGAALGEEVKEAIESTLSSVDVVGRLVDHHAKTLLSLLTTTIEEEKQDQEKEPDGNKTPRLVQVNVHLEDQLLGIIPLRAKTIIKHREVSLGYDGGTSANETGPGDANTTSGDENSMGILSSLVAMMDPSAAATGPTTGAGPSGGWVTGTGTSGSSSSYNLKSDKLNLAGLLNTLDGCVPTPQRIIVMTTNHPERLDPALIRPGRIDKKIFLGFITSKQLVPMLEHYFQVDMSALQRRRVEAAISGALDDRPAMNLTPAQVEQMSCEHESLDGMLLALEAKAKALSEGAGIQSEICTSLEELASSTAPPQLLSLECQEEEEESDELVDGFGPCPAKLKRQISPSTLSFDT